MTVYATSDEYETYTGATAPANVAALLRSCSLLVAREIRTAIYLTDDNDIPTDPDVIAALRDATCAQAAAWDALGINPLTGGVTTTGPAASKSLDGASVSYAGGDLAAKARADATDCLVPDAYAILEQAGLTSARVRPTG